jgi:hypothetical protein
MVAAGQIATASRTSSRELAGGLSSSRKAMPSSSRWSKTSGAAITHCPDATHFGSSSSTRMLCTSFVPCGGLTINAGVTR